MMIGLMEAESRGGRIKKIQTKPYMKELKNFIQEALGRQIRLGAGSSGVAYDLGNGFVRKTIRVSVSEKSPHKKEHEIIERWARIKKGLTVIPYIKDADYDGYTMEKMECPCDEGRLIASIIDEYLFSAWRDEWKPNKIEAAKQEFGEEKVEWVMDWLDKFAHDYDFITDGKFKRSEDLRSSNIGKDKKGNVVCFDWFDPFCV